MLTHDVTSVNSCTRAKCSTVFVTSFLIVYACKLGFACHLDGLAIKVDFKTTHGNNGHLLTCTIHTVHHVISMHKLKILSLSLLLYKKKVGACVVHGLGCSTRQVFTCFRYLEGKHGLSGNKIQRHRQKNGLELTMHPYGGGRGVYTQKFGYGLRMWPFRSPKMQQSGICFTNRDLSNPEKAQHFIAVCKIIHV